MELGIDLSRAWRAALRPLAGSIAVAACGCACTSAPPGIPPLPDTTASSSRATSSARNEREAVADAYTRFWPRLHEAAGAAEPRWAELMTEVATDPQLDRTLTGLRQQRAQSRTLYGAEAARITNIDVLGDRATVTDCQDTSNAGQADANTGDRKTVGIARNPVSATLIRGPDQRWRLSEISYPGGIC